MLRRFLWLLGTLVLVYSYSPVAKAAGSLSFSDTPITAAINAASDALAPSTALKFADPTPTYVPPVSDFHEPNPIGTPSVEDFHTPPTGDIFAGNEQSLVARAVGSAEGTRRPDGGFNQAYSGHVDPGNRVWNRGSFSYQHEASSPEDADAKQLNVLASQAETLKVIAKSYSMDMTQEELLNGIDLANQSPKAALSKGGYIDWLAEAKQLGMVGAEAILYARTNSYINPSTGQLDAPGLGNSWGNVEHDQARRMGEVNSAIVQYPK